MEYIKRNLCNQFPSSRANMLLGIFVCFFMLACTQGKQDELMADNTENKGVENVESVTIAYDVSDQDILNPGRGFYYPFKTESSEFKPLVLDQLSRLRNEPYQNPDANYQVRHSIFLRQYILDSFVKEKTLSDSFLSNLQQDLDIARQAGVKLLIRFSYNNVPPTGDCGSWICPPYGDASKEVVLSHIEQVGQVLNQNHDVLLAWQAGFIGTWGEMMFTDHFGDFDTQGTIYDENWQDRIDMVTAILDAVPNTIPVQVRKPQLIQKFAHGVHAPVTSDALSKVQAFSGSHISRLGLYNDCFLATEDDWGTYADYGTSDEPPVNNADTLKALKQHQTEHSKYTLVGGETCDDAYSPQNDCSGGVVDIIDRFNFSYLNSAYNNLVNNDWQQEGCMDEIKRRLGYRLSLASAHLPINASIGKPMPFKITIINSGFTSVSLPMQLRIVFIHADTQETYAIALDTSAYDIRQWRPEQYNVIDGHLSLRPNMPAGQYDMALHIADVSNEGRISHRPEYSIQLANIDTWDEQTGFNDLLHQITITD